MKPLFFILSWLIVSFGQPSSSFLASILSASFGFALFWKGLVSRSPRQIFWVSFLWASFVQAIQLSWMTSIYYMGPFMWAVYLFFIIAIGLQFALFSSLVMKKEKDLFSICVLASLWTLFEWSRLFFLTGFTWNQVGLSLASSFFSLQTASLFGIYGMSFWVIFTNLIAFSRRWKAWIFAASTPYCLGGVLYLLKEKIEQKGPKMSVALVDTALRIEEKYREPNHLNSFIPPVEQWKKIWQELRLTQNSLDWILLPEGALPFALDQPIATFESVQWQWEQEFQVSSFPPLKPPFAYPIGQNPKRWGVTHAFFAQMLANHYEAEVVLGLSLMEKGLQHNAALQFLPHQEKRPRWYAKQILAPVGEYIPLGQFAFLSSWLEKQFGIVDSFTPGTENTLFSSKMASSVDYAALLCLEETHGEVVRKFCQKGAHLLLGLSTDGWFPDSTLAEKHFDQARLRAVENGVYFLRASNLGITAIIDCFGRTIASMDRGGVLYRDFFLSYFLTPYTFWGDSAIVLICCAFLFAFVFKRKKMLARFLSLLQKKSSFR